VAPPAFVAKSPDALEPYCTGPGAKVKKLYQLFLSLLPINAEKMALSILAPLIIRH